jgi:fumarate reductase subunit D
VRVCVCVRMCESVYTLVKVFVYMPIPLSAYVVVCACVRSCVLVCVLEVSIHHEASEHKTHTLPVKVWCYSVVTLLSQCCCGVVNSVVTVL